MSGLGPSCEPEALQLFELSGQEPNQAGATSVRNGQPGRSIGEAESRSHGWLGGSPSSFSWHGLAVMVETEDDMPVAKVARSDGWRN